jgi:hypothetical protein
VGPSPEATGATRGKLGTTYQPPVKPANLQRVRREQAPALQGVGDFGTKYDSQLRIARHPHQQIGNATTLDWMKYPKIGGKKSGQFKKSGWICRRRKNKKYKNRIKETKTQEFMRIIANYLLIPATK